MFGYQKLEKYTLNILAVLEQGNTPVSSKNLLLIILYTRVHPQPSFPRSTSEVTILKCYRQGSQVATPRLLQDAAILLQCDIAKVINHSRRTT